MFDFSKPFGLTRLFLLASAAFHIVVILVSLGGYIVPMLGGAVLWLASAFGLRSGNRWLAGLVFFLVLFAAVTVPLAYAMTETGLTSLAFWGITFADLGAALTLFVALWRSPKPVAQA